MLPFPSYAADLYRVAVLDVQLDNIGSSGQALKGSLGAQYQCVLNHSGLALADLQVYPVARLVSELGAGTLDIGLGLAPVAERDRVGIYAGTLMNLPYVLLVPVADAHRFQNPGDEPSLQGLNIAALRASVFAALASEQQGWVSPVASHPQAIAMAEAGRVDAALVPAVMADALSAAQRARLAVVSWGIFQSGMYVSRQRPDAEQVVEALRQGITYCPPNPLP
ncbi:substrate-binding periplasmic protein [Thalassolituus sp. LLYu03]|uniref:substrate-binding periplasmic protein n=1 Tax=Thalassolituus sp. LLYu03 TaxID=3421656 RepID=UPI003D27DD1B